MTAAQTELWQTRGIGATRIFVNNRSTDETCEWVKQPSPRAISSQLTWYVDASQVDAEVEGAARVGYAGVAVSEQGTLEAAFRGIPPAHVKTIAAAEAWAIYKVMATTPDRRTIYTDCLSNLSIAQSGYKAATAASNPTARIWGLIFAAADGAIDTYDLQWMPAHKSRCQIGKALKSCGRPITALDWLSNMAVDELAKSAARSCRVPEATRTRVRAAKTAALFWRSRLGRVTHASQNHITTSMNERGEPATTVHRDSEGKPRAVPDSQVDENQQHSTQMKQQPLQPPPPPPPPPPVEERDPWLDTCNIVDTIFRRAISKASKTAYEKAGISRRAQRRLPKKTPRPQQKPSPVNGNNHSVKQRGKKRRSSPGEHEHYCEAPNENYEQQQRRRTPAQSHESERIQKLAAALSRTANEASVLVPQPVIRPSADQQIAAEACYEAQVCPSPISRSMLKQQLVSQLKARRTVQRSTPPSEEGTSLRRTAGTASSAQAQHRGSRAPSRNLTNFAACTNATSKDVLAAIRRLIKPPTTGADYPDSRQRAPPAERSG